MLGKKNISLIKKLDDNQNRLLKQLEEISKTIQPISWVTKLKKIFKKNTYPNGIYLYGTVGSGKTMLMELFYKKINVNKKMVHYHSFMNELHIMIQKIKSINHHYKLIKKLAISISKTIRVLCIDELEIKDISDAMIIQKLVDYLIKNNVFLFFTSNISPDNIYKDGLNRELIFPFINIIKSNFLVLSLNSDKDYRYKKINSNIYNKRIIFPINKQSKKNIKKIIKTLCNNNKIQPSNIKILGRNICFKKVYKDTLLTTFTELCISEFSYVDYVAICKVYSIIVLEDVPELKADEINLVIRLIQFIDSAYFYKVLLFVTLTKHPSDIYKHEKMNQEFQRTISRLQEMDSINYLQDFYNDRSYKTPIHYF